MQYLKIKKATLVPDKYGKHIEITMIGLYDENDKWIKWVSLDDEILEVLLYNKIIIEE